MTHTTPAYYYTVNNPTNPSAQAKTTLRTTEHQFWEHHLPDPDADIEQAVATLTIATGEARNRITTIILALYQLADLPQLNTLQHHLYHLDIQRLIVISNALFGLDPIHLPIIDDHLTNYLTPTTTNQTLPTTTAIRNKIKALRHMLDDPKATPTTTKDYDVSYTPDGCAHLYATVTELNGKIIDDAVSKHATATGKTTAEAFIDLILGNIDVQVTLNLYTATDLADAPVWASGTGWVDAATGNYWTEKATRTQNMDTARDKHLDGYTASPEIAAAVKGRDGTCRFPGCNVPAIRCDCDHRVNHADGGPTCAHNLCSLCRHHHNPKTAGRVCYLMDPTTGIVIWLLTDGTWAVTVPEGPLSPAGARWAQTVSQYRSAHHRRWAAAATNTDSGDSEEAPPF